MAFMLTDLEALVQESIQFVSASASDIPQLLTWGARREAIFAGLQNADFELQRDEEESAVKLIRQIIKLDTAIIVRLEKELGVLEQEIITTNKMRQLLKTQAVNNTPVLLQRIA
jgi:hypothetical protein